MINPFIDVFPAFVSITPADVDIELNELSSSPPSRGSLQVTIARAVVTKGRVIVAQDSGHGAIVVFNEEIDPATFSKSRDISTVDTYVQTLSGKKVAFKKDSTCGCGSRLKSWSPSRFLINVSTPTASLI